MGYRGKGWAYSPNDERSYETFKRNKEYYRSRYSNDDEEDILNPYSQSSSMWDAPEENQWDDNYSARQQIEKNTEKLQNIGVEPEAPETKEKGWLSQLGEFLGIGAIGANFVAGGIDKQNEIHNKEKQIIYNDKEISDLGFGVSRQLGTYVLTDKETGEKISPIKAKTYGKEYDTDNYWKANTRLNELIKLADANHTSLSEMGDMVGAGYESAKNTFKLGINPVDDKSYSESGIVDYGIILDKEKQRASEIGDTNSLGVVEGIEKTYNPAYYISKAVISRGKDEWTEEDEQLARTWGNIGFDIGTSFATASFTDIDFGGKALKYVKNNDEVKNAQKIINNTESMKKAVDNTTSLEDFKDIWKAQNKIATPENASELRKLATDTEYAVSKATEEMPFEKFYNEIDKDKLLNEFAQSSYDQFIKNSSNIDDYNSVADAMEKMPFDKFKTTIIDDVINSTGTTEEALTRTLAKTQYESAVNELADNLRKVSEKTLDGHTTEEFVEMFDKFKKDFLIPEAQHNVDKALGGLKDFDGLRVGIFKVGTDTLDKLASNKFTKALTVAGLTMTSPITAISEATKGVSKGALNVADKLTGGNFKIAEKGQEVANSVSSVFGGKYYRYYKAIKDNPDVAYEYASMISKDKQGKIMRDFLTNEAINEGQAINKVMKKNNIEKPANEYEVRYEKDGKEKVLEGETTNVGNISEMAKDVTEKKVNQQFDNYKTAIKEIKEGKYANPDNIETNLFKNLSDSGIDRKYARSLSRSDYATKYAIAGDFTSFKNRVETLKNVDVSYDDIKKSYDIIRKNAEDVKKIIPMEKTAGTIDNLQTTQSKIKNFTEFTSAKGGRNKTKVGDITLDEVQKRKVNFKEALAKNDVGQATINRITKSKKYKDKIIKALAEGDDKTAMELIHSSVGQVGKSYTEANKIIKGINEIKGTLNKLTGINAKDYGEYNKAVNIIKTKTISQNKFNKVNRARVNLESKIATHKVDNTLIKQLKKDQGLYDKVGQLALKGDKEGLKTLLEPSVSKYLKIQNAGTLNRRLESQANRLIKAFSEVKDNVGTILSKDTKKLSYEDFKANIDDIMNGQVDVKVFTDNQVAKLDENSILKKMGVNENIINNMSREDMLEAIDAGLNNDLYRAEAIVGKYAPEMRKSTKEVEKIKKAFNEVNDNIETIIRDNNTTKSIETYRDRLITDKDKALADIKKVYGKEVEYQVRKELQIENNIDSISKDLEQGRDIEKKLNKLEFDINTKNWQRENTTADEIMNKYKEMYPDESSKLDKLQPRYKNVYKLVDKYKDKWDNLPEAVRDKFYKIKDDLRHCAVTEGIVVKEDGEQFGEYLFHMIAGKKPDKELLRVAKEKGWIQYDPNNFNALKRTKHGSIEDINKSVGQKLFEDNLGAIYAQRMANNIDYRYKTSYMETFFKNFGVEVSNNPRNAKKMIKSATDNDTILCYKTPNKTSNNLIDPNKAGQMSKQELLEAKRQGKKIAELLDNPSGWVYGKYNTLDISNMTPRELSRWMLDHSDVKLYEMKRVHYNTNISLINDNFRKDINGFVKVFDKLSNVFKTQALSSPRYLINNLYGNAYNSYIGAGVNLFNPFNLKKAYGLFKGKDGNIGDLSFDEIRMGSRLANIQDVQSNTTIAGKTFDEKIQGLTKAETKVDKVKNGVGKITGSIRKLSTDMEEISKFSNIVSHLESGKNLSEAIELTQKALFDYSDLSKIETDVLKRLIPFYTFMKKNAGLQLDIMMNNPSRIARVSNVPRKLQEKGLSERENELRPEYMDEYVPVGNQEYINTQNPFASFVENLNPKNVINSANPLIKVPFELANNKSTFSGQEIADETKPKSEQLKSYGTYALNQFMPLTQVLTGTDRTRSSWAGNPIKTFDMEQASKNAMWNYANQLKAQYNNTLEANPKLKTLSEIQTLQKNIKTAEYKGYDTTEMEAELKKLLEEFNKM